jgi:hypothetical protein
MDRSVDVLREAGQLHLLADTLLRRHWVDVPLFSWTKALYELHLGY